MIAELSLPATRDAVASSRSIVDTARLDPMRSAEAKLMVSELVTNAIHHGGLTDDDTIEVELDRADRYYRFTVSHRGAPIVLPPETGFGFSLVDRLAVRWGLDAHAAAVWFEVARAGATSSATETDEDELLARIGVDPDARHELVARHQPLIGSIVSRFRNKGVADDDLHQVALMAFVKAMHRFDVEKGSFRAYAATTMKGELKRHLRDKAWAVRVPRSLQERALEVAGARRRLEAKLGRVPRADEIATEIDMDIDDVLAATAANTAYRSTSLDTPLGEDADGSTLGDMLGGEDPNLVLVGQFGDVAEAASRLPERQQRILYLRFYEDMTQSEIADVVGVSQMHVSRLLARALKTLQEEIEA